MLNPIEFNLSPSCSDCISWSADGDLAIAGGDHVQILTPKPRPRDGPSSTRGEAQWTTTKLATNTFTNEEWPPLDPQPGPIFSAGEEQSASHVSALAWSPPGLASYGRCVLGVLSSNLVLSLWEAVDGHAQWKRVAVANHALQDKFQTRSEGEEALQLQAQRVRGFCWSPALPAPTQRRRCRQLICVSNDTTDIVILEVRSKPSPQDGEERILSTKVVSVTSLASRMYRYPHPQMNPNSIFAEAMRKSRVINYLSWGPWLQCNTTTESGEEASGYVSDVALIDFPETLLLRVGPLSDEAESFSDMGLTEKRLKAQIEKLAGDVHPTSFLSWIHGGDNDTIGLIFGTAQGCLSITLSKQEYTSPEETSSISARGHLLSPYGESNTVVPDMYPITGAAKSFDTQLGLPSVHIVSLSSRTTCLAYPSMETIPPNPVQRPTESVAYESSWRAQIESFRSQFDLDYDLRGNSIAKTWGLASFRDRWIAACFSLHPTDMFEQVMASKLRSRVVFAQADHEGSRGDGDAAMDMPWDTPSFDQGELQQARDKVLRFTLDTSNREIEMESSTLRGGPWFKKLLYAAACCAIVLASASQRPELLSAARTALKWLGSETGVDMGTEISTIDGLESPTTASAGAPVTIPVRNPDSLLAAADLFETCDVCGAGIEWYSPTESQCAEGHLFVRCGVTFLSIQDPQSAKRCSRCSTEVLRRGVGPEDGDDSAGVSSMLDLLLDEFDTCVYCKGKFRA